MGDRAFFRVPFQQNPRIQMLEQTLAWLLMAANSSPPYLVKEEFYQIKYRLLESNATQCGVEWQHISKECWTCGGTGWYDPLNVPCNRCVDGMYDEAIIPLTLWTWNGHRFHIPGPRTHHIPLDAKGESVAIAYHGVIKKRAHWAHHEAALWLFLLYDHRTFFRIMKVTRAGGSQPNLPLTLLQKLVFNLNQLRWAARYRLARCRQRIARKPIGEEELPF